jgi:hypothetical protein
MVNCDRCKKKTNVKDLFISHDHESGKIRKYCKECTDIINIQNKHQEKTITKKEKPFENIPEEQDQKLEEEIESESELIMVNDMKTEISGKYEMKQNVTDIIPRDSIIQKIDTYLNDEGLNIGKDEYCYIKIVGNHLEIGRAKIVLEE